MTTEDGIFLIPYGLSLLLGGRFESESTQSESDYPALLCLTERTCSSNIETNLTTIATVSVKQQQCPDIDEFWSLERIGITDSPIDNDDVVAQRQFEESVEFEDGRYNVSWPWKDNRHLLPTNYALAVGRLRSLSKRLSSTDNMLLKEYQNTIEDQLNRGVIELVPPDERISTSNAVHYLPHHPIVRSNNNTTKVRIVYDASAKCRKDQMSLNECMYRGPVILPDLCSILIRFRLHEMAIIADIEKAFLQLGLQRSERDVTRFLWFKDTGKLGLDDNIEVYRFKRVPFGAISSPFLLAATIQHHLKQNGSDLADRIRNNIYVDNVISGPHTEEEATQFYDQSKHSQASMNLREWCSNSARLLQHIPEIDRCPKLTSKVLGLNWHSDCDKLQLQNNWDDKSRMLRNEMS